MDKQNNKEQTINRIKEAFNKNPSGFTLNMNGQLLNLNKGYCYSITNNFSNDINLLIENLFILVKQRRVKHYFIGGWVDNGIHYLDISFITNKKTRAIFQAIKHNQLAIFDIAKLDSIYL